MAIMQVDAQCRVSNRSAGIFPGDILTKIKHTLQFFRSSKLKLHPGPCSCVGMQRGIDRHTDTQKAVANIHFASPIPHAKCNNKYNEQSAAALL